MSNQGFFKNLMILMEIFENYYTLLNKKKNILIQKLKACSSQRRCSQFMFIVFLRIDLSCL